MTRIEQEIDEVMASGLYKIVDLDLFKNIDKIKIDPKVLEYLNETMIDYQTYLDEINKLSPTIQLAFLRTLEKQELLHNQESEKENSFIIAMQDYLKKLNSIELAMFIQDNKGCLVPDDIKLIHQVLMDGTENKQEFGFRTKNDKFVGSLLANGDRNINYFPMKHENLESAMEIITNYLNETGNNKNDVFIKPFIAHGLIAGIQAFGDGNTRLARLIQHIKIWDLTKKYHLSYLDLPALYMSKSYNLMRTSYRRMINNIVINNDDPAWNEWFMHNLNAVNEQIYFGNNNLQALKKRG